jgi:UDP-glucuronate 4-epimerase
MRALVTGCAGFIGSHLTESLLTDGHSVVGVDCFNDNYGRAEKLRNLEPAKNWEDFELVAIDLSRGDLRELVEECDCVFHLAAEPGVRTSWGKRFDSYLRNNVLATQHLLEAAREWPEKRFIYASSSSVYGEAERLPTSEDVTPLPFSPYGVTKLDAEHLCRVYHSNYGVEAVILRYFSVYGPRQRPDMAFSRFCDAAIRNEQITVFGDGEQTRDFTFVADVVSATRLALKKGAAGRVLNVGGGSQVSVRAALEIISDVAGRRLEVTYLPPMPGDVRHTSADTARAHAELGFEAATRLEAGLRAQFAWALEANAASTTRITGR